MALLAPAWLSCGDKTAEPPGGLRELAHYSVSMSVTDEPDLNSNEPQREMLIQFFGRGVSTPQTCASLKAATARFGGQPILIDAPGGWYENRIPTGTAPGETINADGCRSPFFKLIFPHPVGEPQNGTLELEESGLRFAVPYDHTFGTPRMTLISATRTQMVVQLADFVVMPQAEAIRVDYHDSHGIPETFKVTGKVLTNDGRLEVTLAPSGTESGPLYGRLGVWIDLGREALPCAGFLACTADSAWHRWLNVDPERPMPIVTPTPTLPPP